MHREYLQHHQRPQHKDPRRSKQRHRSRTLVQLPQESKTRLPSWRPMPFQKHHLHGHCKRWKRAYQRIHWSHLCYIQLFKERLGNHIQSFKTKSKSNSTELSKYIWRLKDKGITDLTIKWSIVQRAAPYNPATKRCNLCYLRNTLLWFLQRTQLLIDALNGSTSSQWTDFFQAFFQVL